MSLLLSAGLFVASLLFKSWGNADWYEGYINGGLTVGAAWFAWSLIDKMKLTFTEIVIILVGALFLFKSNNVPIPVPLPSAPSRTPLLPWRGEFSESDGVGPGGVEITTDIPPEYRKANISSKGLGCCVFRSIDHAAHWQNIPVLYGMPEWMKSSGIEGGGYPQKVDKLVPQMAKAKGQPTPEYVQHTGGDMAFLEKSLEGNRMVCITYAGMDPRYGKTTGIDHMVNLVYLDKNVAAILDNNYVNKYLWMTRAEFEQRWKARGGGWAITFVAPPPPQPPSNK